MPNIIPRERRSMRRLQHDVEDVLEEFSTPRALQREFDALFEETTNPGTLWRAMDSLLEDFSSPTPMRRRLSSLVDDFLGSSKTTSSRGSTAKDMFMPMIDIDERDDEYVMRADLPGIRDQDVDVRIDNNNVLTISGQRRDESMRRGRGYEYSERNYGAFSRSVELPAGIDATKVRAELLNGVLEVHVARAETARRQKIPVSREQPRAIPVTTPSGAQA
jgi:HSP20 family protein